MTQPDPPGGSQPELGNIWPPSGNAQPPAWGAQPPAPDARPSAGGAPPPTANAAWGAGYGLLPAPAARRPAAGASRAGRLRQIWWASVPVWSLGFLSFAPFLWLAVSRQRRRDWAIFAGDGRCHRRPCQARPLEQRGRGEHLRAAAAGPA